MKPITDAMWKSGDFQRAPEIYAFLVIFPVASRASSVAAYCLSDQLPRMCQQCAALEKAHRDYIQTYLHLTAQKSQARREHTPTSADLDAALSEAVGKLNEAWQRLVEHRARHVLPVTVEHSENFV
jgi:hypothetical protein